VAALWPWQLTASVCSFRFAGDGTSDVAGVLVAASAILQPRSLISPPLHLVPPSQPRPFPPQWRALPASATAPPLATPPSPTPRLRAPLWTSPTKVGQGRAGWAGQGRAGWGRAGWGTQSGCHSVPCPARVGLKVWSAGRGGCMGWTARSRFFGCQHMTRPFQLGITLAAGWLAGWLAACCPLACTHMCTAPRFCTAGMRYTVDAEANEINYGKDATPEVSPLARLLCMRLPGLCMATRSLLTTAQ